MSDTMTDNSWLYEVVINPVFFEQDVSSQSTAISRVGYNPATQEFMIQWKSSDKRYIYPDVTGDEAADFFRNAWEAEPKASYGKAANTFKGLHESTRVREIRYNEAVDMIGAMNFSEVRALVKVLREFNFIR